LLGGLFSVAAATRKKCAVFLSCGVFLYTWLRNFPGLKHVAALRVARTVQWRTDHVKKHRRLRVVKNSRVVGGWIPIGAPPLLL